MTVCLVSIFLLEAALIERCYWKGFTGWITVVCMMVVLAACAGAQPIAPEATATEITFHPTDPKTVNLQAGKPQFVEFFAFW
jgi:hypothetical protein